MPYLLSWKNHSSGSNKKQSDSTTKESFYQKLNHIFDLKNGKLIAESDHNVNVDMTRFLDFIAKHPEVSQDEHAYNINLYSLPIPIHFETFKLNDKSLLDLVFIDHPVHKLDGTLNVVSHSSNHAPIEFHFGLYHEDSDLFNDVVYDVSEYNPLMSEIADIMINE